MTLWKCLKYVLSILFAELEQESRVLYTISWIRFHSLFGFLGLVVYFFIDTDNFDIFYPLPLLLFCFFFFLIVSVL